MAVLAVFALALTWLQLKELRHQRDIVESLDLSDRLERCFYAWKRSVDGEADALAIEHAVGGVVSLYEIVAGALNLKALPKNARALLRHHLRDGLGLICSHSRSRKIIIKIAQDKCVYKSTRQFILENFSFVRRGTRSKSIYLTFFEDHDVSLVMDRGPRGMLVRRAHWLHLRLLKRTR